MEDVLALPSTMKHGKYSNALKGTKLGSRLKKVQEDKAYLDLKDEIYVISAILDELLEKLAADEEVFKAKDLKKLYESAILCGRRGDDIGFQFNMQSLGEHINGLYKYQSLITEVREVTRLKMSLVDSQSKREIQLEQMMKAEDVSVILKVLLHEIRGVIYDRLENKSHAADILLEISQKFASVLGEGFN